MGFETRIENLSRSSITGSAYYPTEYFHTDFRELACSLCDLSGCLGFFSLFTLSFWDLEADNFLNWYIIVIGVWVLYYPMGIEFCCSGKQGLYKDT